MWGISDAARTPAADYDFADFEQDFSRIAAALPNVRLAGPTDGAPSWFEFLGRFLSDQPRVAVATLHRYPLQQCFARPGGAELPDDRQPARADLLAGTGRQRHRGGARPPMRISVPLRIDEMNTISCGNVTPAVDRLVRLRAVGARRLVRDGAGSESTASTSTPSPASDTRAVHV